MTDTIIKEVRSPHYQSNRSGKAVIVGSFILRTYTSGKREVLTNNDKSFTDQEMATYHNAIKNEQAIPF